MMNVGMSKHERLQSTKYPTVYNTTSLSSSCTQRSHPRLSEKNCSAAPSLGDPAVFMQNIFFFNENQKPPDSPAQDHSVAPRL